MFGSGLGLAFRNHYFFDFVTLTDGVDYLKSFHHFTEAGMFAIQMAGIVPAVADEKLGSAGVSSRMGHGKDTPIVVLVVTGEFTIYLVPWTPGAVSFWATSLYHKVGDDPVESQSIIEAFLGKGNEIFDCLWGIVFIELHGHGSFFGDYICLSHHLNFGKNRNNICGLSIFSRYVGQNCLEGSAQVHSLSIAGEGQLGGLALNPENNVVDLSFSGTANFVHEVPQRGRFEDGRIGFNSSNGGAMLNDVYDEVGAYRGRFSFSPSPVWGLPSISRANSFSSIGVSWEQGVIFGGRRIYL